MTGRRASGPCPVCGDPPVRMIRGEWPEPFKQFPCSRPVPATVFQVVGYVCASHGEYMRTDVPLPEFVRSHFDAR